MGTPAKSAQLQIRVTDEQKTAIQEAATRAGMDMSAYVLSRVLTAASVRFKECVLACSHETSSRFARRNGQRCRRRPVRRAAAVPGQLHCRDGRNRMRALFHTRACVDAFHCALGVACVRQFLTKSSTSSADTLSTTLPVQKHLH